MIPKATQIKLNKLAYDYADRLLLDVKGVLGLPGYRTTGELANSLAISVKEATDEEPPKIALTYADQGFYIGYKNPSWTKLPEIERLKDWVKSKSLALGDIPGYEYGTAPALSVDQRATRIAWAIAKNKRREDTWKRKKWKNAAKLGDLLKELNSDSLKAYSMDIEEMLASAISTGKVMS
jgi:hypothetical protein